MNDRICNAVLTLVLALGLTAGCSSDPDDVGLCGDGEQLTGANGAAVCLYTGELIEEGFLCPEELSQQIDLQDGGVVCSEGEQLPPDIAEELATRGHQPAGNNGWNLSENNGTNNGATTNNAQTNNAGTNNGATNNGGTNNGDINNSTSPSPVTFRIELTTDVPEDYWAQIADDRGMIGWVRLVWPSDPGRDSHLVAPCALNECGVPGFGTCAPPDAQKFVDMAYTGQIEWTWDGMLRTETMDSCYIEESALPGLYTVEFCVGPSATDTNGGDPMGFVVDNPTCVQREFDHPNTPEVVWNADFGG